MITKKSKGGGLAINPNHIFADNTARDAYFALHPTELVKGTFISVGTGYEEYDGSSFENKTSVVTGPSGSAGSIQVGTVTTLPAGSLATVVNTGTTNSAIFDFGIPKGADGAGGGSATWGGITGTLSAQTDLNSALNGKQATLISGTNIKTINGTSVLGSGNIVISGGGGGGAVDSVNGQTGTVVLTQDNIADGTTYKQYSATEKTKVSKIVTSGDGLQYLANDGTYKTVSGGGTTTIYNEWLLANAYVANDLVVYLDSKVYKANDTIPANTPFAIGTTGATWTLQTLTAGETVFLAKSRSVITLGVVTTETVLEKGFAENNEIAIPKKTRNTKSMKFMFIGSSLCHGASATTYAESYAGLLTAYLYTLTDVYYINSINTAIGGENSTIIRDRIVKDAVTHNPDIVFLGICSNNDGLYATGTSTILDTYMKNIKKISDQLTKHNITHFLVGEYPHNSITANAWLAKKVLNFRMQKLFGSKYLNVLGSLSVDATGVYKTGIFADVYHLNSAGHAIMYGAMDKYMFANGITRSNFVPTKAGSVLNVNTMTAFILYPIDTGTTDYVNEYTTFVDVRLTPSAVPANKTLMRVKSTNGSSTYMATIATNASGAICLYEQGTLKVTSTVKLSTNYKVQVGLRTSAVDNLIYLVIDGVVIGSYTPTIALGYNIARLNLGCDQNSAANTAQYFEFSNLVVYRGCLDLYTISMIGKRDYPQSNLIYAHNLNLVSGEDLILPSQNDNGVSATLSASNAFVPSGEIENIFTNAEKTKLATIDKVGIAVASATTIVAPSTVFHVTGTTAISTITVPYTGFTGNITIIPDGIFTLATGGNIFEAYTAVVGRAIQLVFDGTSWYRVNN